MSELTVRSVMIQPFSGSDDEREGVANLVLAIQREEFGVPITLQEQPDLQDIKQFFQFGVGNFWLAMDPDTQAVVGTTGLLDIGEGMAVIRKMFVHEAFRGKPHRVAQQLLDTVFAHCREQGVNEVILGTIDKYHAAHRFYEKNGFLPIAEADLPSNFPRMKVDNRFYHIRF